MIGGLAGQPGHFAEQLLADADHRRLSGIGFGPALRSRQQPRHQPLARAEGNRFGRQLQHAAHIGIGEVGNRPPQLGSMRRNAVKRGLGQLEQDRRFDADRRDEARPSAEPGGMAQHRSGRDQPDHHRAIARRGAVRMELPRDHHHQPAAIIALGLGPFADRPPHQPALGEQPLAQFGRIGPQPRSLPQHLASVRGSRSGHGINCNERNSR